MISRKQKRAVIISVYVVIFFGLIWVVASWLRADPTCFDGKLNQDEIGVDCGGVCKACDVIITAQPVVMTDTFILDGGGGTIDVVATMSNPNTHFGAGQIGYRLTVKDVNDSVIASQAGTTFILPLEQKYIMALALEPIGDIAVTDISQLSATWEIDDIVWQRFEQFETPNIVITNKSYQLVATGVNYSAAKALVRNQSPYDFNTITVNVVLKDVANVPIAVHQTQLYTVDAGTVREFTTPWPYKFVGDVANFDVQAYVDVFDSQNFRKKYLPGGQYQQTQKE